MANRLDLPPNNSLYYSVPTPAAPQRQIDPRLPARQQLENLSAGLGYGITSQLEDLKALATDPKAYGQNILRALKAVAQQPSLLGNALRESARRAASGPLGAGEVVGGMLPLRPGGKTPLKHDIFIGDKARTWNAAAAQRAQEMEADGATPEQIWRETGTFRSPDGKWRQEISDLPATWTENKSGKVLSDVLNHPELYKAYPDMAQVPVRLPTKEGRYGSYTPPYFPGGEAIEVGPSDRLNVALHESMHGIQEKQNFARGGQPFIDTPVEDYVKTAKLITNFGPKINEIIRLNRLLPKDERLPYMVGWAEREFDAYGYMAHIEDTVKNPEIRQKLLEITEELAAERDKVYGMKQGILLESEKLKNYKRIPGEAEARAVEARAAYPPSVLRERLPTLDYDVPLNELTIRR